MEWEKENMNDNNYVYALGILFHVYFRLKL